MKNESQDNFQTNPRAKNFAIELFLVPRPSGDGEIYARVVRAMYTDDQVVREAARRVVGAFPPGEQPPDFRVSDLYADLGKGGRFNSWMLGDVEKVESDLLFTKNYTLSQ